MKTSAQRLWLIMLLFITLALTAYVSKKDTGSSEIVGVAAKRSSVSDSDITHSVKTNSDTYSDVHIIRSMSDPKKDIFQTKVTIEEKKQEAKPVVAVVIPKPLVILPPVVTPPAAPPIPFKYIGKYYDQGGLVIFLNFNGKNLIVKSGDIIQQTYRIEEVKPPILTMTYLPMDIKQIINIGDLN